jgi:hypothetical protein
VFVHIILSVATNTTIRPALPAKEPAAIEPLVFALTEATGPSNFRVNSHSLEQSLHQFRPLVQFPAHYRVPRVANLNGQFALLAFEQFQQKRPFGFR